MEIEFNMLNISLAEGSTPKARIRREKTQRDSAVCRLLDAQTRCLAKAVLVRDRLPYNRTSLIRVEPFGHPDGFAILSRSDTPPPRFSESLPSARPEDNRDLVPLRRPQSGVQRSKFINSPDLQLPPPTYSASTEE